MCLHTRQNVIEIAKKPIKVYKVIKLDNKSLYQDFQYQPDTLYRLRKALAYTRVGDYGYEFDAGFHAYRDVNNLYYSYRNKVVEFTIPKGARFIIGQYNEIVSTSIRSGDLKSVLESVLENVFIKETKNV